MTLARGFAGNFTRGNVNWDRGGKRRCISVLFGSAQSRRRSRIANPVDHFNWRDEAVTQSWKRFDVARSERRIAKCGANFFYGCIQAVLKIDKRLRRPELFAQHFAADDVTGAVQKQIEDLKGLRPDLQLQAMLVEFAATRPRFVGAESKGLGRCVHGWTVMLEAFCPVHARTAS